MNPQDPKLIDDLVSQLVNNNPNNKSPNPNPPNSLPRSLPDTNINVSKQQQYESSVRTMQSDIEQIKKTQGKDEHLFVPKPKVEILAPKPEIKPPLVKEIIKPPSDKSSFSIPSVSKISPRVRLIILSVPIIVLIGAGIYFYVWNQPDQPSVSEPTPQITKTPVLSSFEYIFGLASDIIIPVSGMESDLQGSIISQLSVNLTPGQLKSYKVLNTQNIQYSLSDFLSIFSPSVADSEAFKVWDWVLVTHSHYDENGNVVNRLFIAAKISDEVQVKNTMLSWQQNNNLIKDMAKLLGYDQNLSQKATLTDDTYNGIGLKFAKVLTRDSGISYAIFNNYLVIASSRDSFRKAIDFLYSPL